MWSSWAFHWFLWCSCTSLEMGLANLFICRLATSDFVLAHSFLSAFFMSILRTMYSGSVIDFAVSSLRRLWR
uniref:Putative product n=1 Tax=Xenopsylla cheopis TaxID=163159 RepID=A0A6M2DVM0_XENCH